MDMFPTVIHTSSELKTQLSVTLESHVSPYSGPVFNTKYMYVVLGVASIMKIKVLNLLEIHVQRT